MAGNFAIQCVGPSYQLPDRKSGVQRAVNLFLREVEGDGEVRRAVLDSAPGTVLHADLGATLRGSYSTESRRFHVAGATLYEVDSSGVASSRGTLLSSTGHVSMKHGRDQLVLVDGSSGYVLNLNTNVFAQITDPDFRGSDWVEELDGYFIFVAPGSDQYYLTSIDDATQLDALDFSSADAQPDNIVTHRVMKRELYLFGDRSIEVWIDSGEPDFPFARYNSTPIDVGIVGKRAAINAADTLFFIGQTKSGRGNVYMIVGHQPVRISNQAVEEALAGSSDMSAATMWTYWEKGNEFIGINAPDMPITWVYDAAMKQWHERGVMVNGEWAARPEDEIVMLNGVQYASVGTKVYTLDNTSTTVGGYQLVFERTWPHLMSPSMEPVVFAGLELSCTTGTGDGTQSITLEISNDGGFVFGSPLQRSLGAVGRLLNKVRWLMLGSAIDRVFRLRTSGVAPFRIYGATVDA